MKLPFNNKRQQDSYTNGNLGLTYWKYKNILIRLQLVQVFMVNCHHMKLSAWVIVLLCFIIVFSNSIRIFSKLSHLKGTQSHLEVQQSPQQKQAAGRFLNFVFSDDDLFQAMMAKHSTPKQNQKVLNWFLQDPFYSKLFLSEIKNQEGNNWMAALNPQNMKKVTKLTFNVIAEDPNYNVFGQKEQTVEPSQAQVKKLINGYLNQNDEVAEAFISSLGFEDHINDHVYTNSLKAANQKWMKWNFQNLTIEQKKEVVIWILQNPAYQPNPKAGSHKGVRQNHKFGGACLQSIHNLIIESAKS